MLNDDWSIPEDLSSGNDAASEITIEMCLAAGANGVMIPNEVYHALPGISGTKIKLLDESNKHLDNSPLFNPGNKKCFDLGTDVHTRILEPHLHNTIVMPKFETKGVTGITIAEAKNEFISANKDRLIISQEDFDLAEKMASNVRAICSDMIDSAICERSMFVEYQGDILKCRIDAQVGDHDYDLKTITPKGGDFSEAAIRRHTRALGYHISAAFRNKVRRELGQKVGDSFLIFVSTSPGHMVKIRRIPPTWIEEADLYLDDLLEGRRFYRLSGIDSSIKVIQEQY